MPSVSLPNGASSLPPKVLSLLERFERIYLWMDDDLPGQVTHISTSFLLLSGLVGRSKEVCAKARIAQVLHCTL